ncbi:phage baseplate upper protein [Tissierella pigra]|uniref:BppU family phage baseplate upper protein n=1 Tax=Tissierella pigra TaxID=2607614 RepID=UPI001C11E805|nr:BppU family phage baseplate upper protein [Tissierella pigra]MBU5425022.1 phage baseplate upper protein [Tissierella pigra]
MQIKEFDIILDIKKYKKIEEIEVVQGDLDTNQLNITIYDGLNLYSLENLNIEIAFAKSDGTTVLQSSQDEDNPIIIEGDKIICTLKTNTIASPGKVLAEVRLLEDTRLLTSTRFELYVRKAIVNDETIESTNEFPILNKLINDVGDIIEAVPVIEGKLDEITNTESELNQSISEGNTLKGDLDSSIQEGNILKAGLDNSIAEGNIVKGELDDIIAGTDFEQVLMRLNDKADKTELENLAGEGRTTETVKDNADRIGILNGKVSPETPLNTISQNLSGAVNEVKSDLTTHEAKKATDIARPHGLGRIASQEYEEGTWNPVWGTATFTLSYARYIRQGNMVHCWLALQVTNKGDAVQTITGLPFVPKHPYTVGTIGQYGNIAFNAGEILYARAFKSSAALQILKTRPNQEVTVVSNADLKDNSYIGIYVAYEI